MSLAVIWALLYLEMGGLYTFRMTEWLWLRIGWGVGVGECGVGGGVECDAVGGVEIVVEKLVCFAANFGDR